MESALSSCSCRRWTLTLAVVILSKHFWHPGYCNTMHICFEWCNDLYGQGNIVWCHLQSLKVCVSYLQHLSQTAEATHADIAVGKRGSFLSRNLADPQLILKKEPVCFPNTLFVMARKRVCIWGLWWLFHAEGLMFHRLMQATKKLGHLWGNDLANIWSF